VGPVDIGAGGSEVTTADQVGHRPFITAEALEPWIDVVVLADVRWSLDGSQGLEQHLETTLPGAVYVDLDADLSGPPTVEGGRHPLPTPAAFAATLGRLGIAEDDVVVAFDHGPGVAPARLVWMLRSLGQRAALLDGGLAAWDGPTAPGGTSRAAAAPRVRPWPEDRLVDTAAVLARVSDDTDALLLDARPAERFAGAAEEPGGAPRGHIPGARSAPAIDNLAGGRLLAPQELRARYAAHGALVAPEVIAYCGSGVAACLDLLALEELGVAGRLYPGSWSAWSADPSRPTATGTG
jgi:thiosulfate/3-mercaptopyruvate sulfurtransferase